MPGLNEISPSQLMRLIGTRDAPVIIDVCIDDDFALDPRLVPTALRCPHRNILGMLPIIGNRKVVVICQKGLKLSHGAAALLRDAGISAEVLEGGNMKWAASNLPLIPVKTMPNGQSTGHTWVTRQRPKIDRIACPWLIRRFVDHQAKFIFVPSTEVQNVAEKFDAIPFDIEGVFWSHRDEGCTFDTMLDEFCLKTPALNRLENVVRAADTNRHDLSPEAAGLLAMSVGLSRMEKDDNRQLNQGMMLYDALYRWARDGFEETHDWPEGQKK